MKNINLKQKLLSLSFGLALGMAGNAFADEGAGVRGGGNVIDVNGTPHLLDLKTTAKCWDDKSGDEIMRTEPGIRVILDNLRKLDWYFADDLEDEIRSLHYCFTGKLKFLPPIDIDAPVLQRELPEYKAIQQLGIRVNDTIFIDQSRLNSGLPSFDRSMFFIHEAVHAYLPMYDRMRKMDLYTVVSAIADAGTPRVPDREKFHYILSHHRVMFPLTAASELEPFEQQVQYLVSRGEKRKQLILAQNEPEVLINLDLAFLNSRIAPWSRSWVSLKDRLSADLYDILKDGSTAEANRLINEQTYSTIRIAQIALSALPKLNRTKQDLLFTSESFLSLGNDVYDWLKSIKAEYSRFRIRANADLQSLAASRVEGESVPIIDLNPRRNSVDQTPLPQAVGALANYTVVLIKYKKWDQVKALVTDNPEFYEGFSLKSAIASVDTLQPKFKTEIEKSKEVIAWMATGLKQRFISVVQGQLTAEEFKTFQSLLQ